MLSLSGVNIGDGARDPPLSSKPLRKSFLASKSNSERSPSLPMDRRFSNEGKLRSDEELGLNRGGRDGIGDLDGAGGDDGS